MEPAPDGRLWAVKTTPIQRYANEWDQEVQLLNLADGKLQRLTHNAQGEGAASFSPGGVWANTWRITAPAIGITIIDTAIPAQNALET